MNRLVYKLTLAVSIPLSCFVLVAQAQEAYRLNDQQMKALIGRLDKQAENFRSSLKDALNHSRLDHTRREDDINQFVKNFDQATDRLKDHFSKNHSAASDVEDVLQRGTVIDRFMQTHELTPRAQNSWMSLRNNLDELAQAYSVSWTWAGGVDRVGVERADRLNDREVKGLVARIDKSAERFRSSLKDALNHSRLDHSRREDDINQFVKDFDRAADRLHDRFDKDHSAAGVVEDVLRRAAVIDRFMQMHELTRRAQDDWLSLRRDLDELARTYNVTWSWVG